VNAPNRQEDIDMSNALAWWEDGDQGAAAEWTASGVTEQVTEWAVIRGADGSEATFYRQRTRAVSNPVARMLARGRARRAALPVSQDVTRAELAEFAGGGVNWPRARAELPAGDDATVYRGRW
jgi:hypothetical protein